MDDSIERDSLCFCCGSDNERGLHLRFSYSEPGRAETSLTLPEYLSGWKGVAHGGFLSMLLDEAMAHACRDVGMAVTGEMTTRFRRPARTGAPVRVVGHLVETRGRMLATRGWIYDAEGAVLAEGSARFFRVDAADGEAG